MGEKSAKGANGVDSARVSRQMAPAQLDDLLAHDQWIRSLAQRLVPDPNVAEDLVQRTWLVALQSRPPSSPRAWLAKVLRSVALKRWREESTRIGHELVTSSSGLEESAADRAARTDMHRALALSLSGLEEPFRRTLEMRYVTGLTSVEIGRRLAVPEGTVRWRLKRGLELLRDELDRRHGGDRRQWIAGLALFLPERVARGTASAGIGLGWLVATLAIAAVVGGAITLHSRGSGDPEPEVVSRDVDTAPAEGGAGEGRPSSERVAAAPGASEDGPGVEPVGAEAGGADERSWLVPVRVVDDAGRPVADASVAVVFGDRLEPRGTTDADGLASLPVAEGDLIGEEYELTRGMVGLRATSNGYAASALVHLAPEALDLAVEAREDFLLRGPEVTVVGRVLDEDGSGVADARVAVDRNGPLFQLSGPARVETEAPLATRTDADGRFELRGSPVTDLRIRVGAEGFLDTVTTRAVEVAGTVECELLLLRGRVVRGIAGDLSGRPVPGARVWYDPLKQYLAHDYGAVPGFERRLGGFSRSVAAGADGSFVLRSVPLEEVRIWALDGERAASTTLPADGPDEVDWHPVLEPREPVRAEVYGPDGRPVAGLRVVMTNANNSDMAWLREETTGEDGATPDLFDWPEVPLTLSVHDPRMPGRPLDRLRGVLAFASPFLFDLEPRAELAGVSGEVRDADGEHLGRGEVLFCHPDGSATGVVAFGGNEDESRRGKFSVKVDSGTYRIFVACVGDGVVPLGEHELRPGDEVSFDHRAEHRGRAVPVGVDEVDDTDLSFRLDAHLAPLERYDQAVVVAEGEGLPREAISVLPGSYVYTVLRDGEPVSRRRVPIDPSRDTPFDVRPGADALVPIRTIDTDDEPVEGGLVVLREVDGEAVELWADPFGERASSVGVWHVPLPAGEFVLEARGPDGSITRHGLTMPKEGSPYAIHLRIE